MHASRVPRVGPRHDGWSEEAGDGPVGASETPLIRLDHAVAALNPYLHDLVIPTGLVINPLLDIWAAVHRIDTSVSSPVEQLPPSW